MFVIFGRNLNLNYSVLLSFAEIFGLLSVILVGLLFDKSISTSSYDWKTNPFSFHPLLMTIGLLFCYGNSIILYRTFRQMSKFTVKILHASLLILSLVFAAIGLTAIIRSKNLLNRSHFMTYHSWIGFTTIILFIFQWFCGFVSFLFPRLSLDFRKGYLPSHRLWGKIIFLSAVASILTGLSEYGMTSSFFTVNDIERTRRLIMNFFGVFTSLFCLIIIYLLSNPDYQRSSEVYVDRSVHNME